MMTPDKARERMIQLSEDEVEAVSQIVKDIESQIKWHVEKYNTLPTCLAVKKDGFPSINNQRVRNSIRQELQEAGWHPRGWEEDSAATLWSIDVNAEEK